MPQIEIEGRVFEVDGDGFLVDPDLWNDEVAELFAKSDGIEEMTDKHWAVVRVIRKHFEENGNAPMVRVLCRDSGVRLKEVYELFPWVRPEVPAVLQDYPNRMDAYNKPADGVVQNFGADFSRSLPDCIALSFYQNCQSREAC